MGRLRNKKFSAHGKAAKSTTANAKPLHAPSSAASARASAVAEAAVKAAFEDDDQDDAELPEGVDQDASDDDDADGDDALSGLSRGQRKRMKRRGAFLRKMGLVKRVVAEKESAKKKHEQGAFAEIQELQDALFLSDKELAARAASKISQATNLTAKTTKASLKPKKLSGKQRQKLAVRELGQLKAVHTHPQFQSDPFAAIQLHLQNTVVQANAATLQKQQATNKKKNPANAMDTE